MAVTCVTSSNDSTTGIIGGPPVICEIKLLDVPDMNYTSDDTPFPRGELCVRGANVIPGYYKDPEKTSEAIDSEGWLHSGDIVS